LALGDAHVTVVFDPQRSEVDAAPYPLLEAA
jgi:hypothetical protein